MQPPRISLLSFLILLTVSVHAQNDSLLLSFEGFLQTVEQNHPLARQIRLTKERAALELMQARGQQLDPRLAAKWKFKQFDSYNYYNIYDAYLTIPTAWGVDIKAGYNGAEGYYLNPQNNLPAAGQAYLGLSVPLLQGLWNNERQTDLRLAKLAKKQAPIEIQSGLNHLFYQAASSYWKWTEAYNNLLIYAQGIEIAKTQFIQIKATFQQGEIPAIDTLKAFIRIQDFEVKFMDAELQERQARWALENHLWVNDSTAGVLAKGSSPLRLDSLDIEVLDSSLLENQLQRLNQHPDLRLYQFKLKMLDLEQRFKQTKLLPKANLEYNFLSANNINFFENTGGIAAVTENYKLGFKLSYPILIRKERADLQLNKIKVRATEFQLNFKRQEIRTKIRSYFNKANSYALQIELLKSMVDNYFTLIEAEREKFSLGESDIFMINTRQQQYIDARLKLYKTQIKFLEARTAWSWATANW